jgi:CRP-like cAMP-binding protein
MLKVESTTRVLEAGEHLFRQGDKAEAIFEVEQGQLRMVRHTSDSRPVIVRSSRSGELFAEASLFSDFYHCDALAVVRTRVRRYAKRHLLAAFRKDAESALGFTAILARQVQALCARLELRNVRSARDRVLQTLIVAADARDRTVWLNGTLKDLAAEIGLTHEALYRALAALERNGKVRRRGDRIVLTGEDL